MAGRPWLVGLIVVALAFGACSKQEETGDHDGGAGTSSAAAGAGTGGTGNGGSAGKGGVGGTGSGAGPAITSAPPVWVRPADCGGIGNLCPNLSGCAALSTCQLEGNVCIPKFPDGATSLPGRTPETPYCAAYTCMTFDEASCFCTGDAGKTVTGCSSPSALAGLCVSQKQSCATKPCCDGLTCADNGSGQKLCQIPCTQGSDCASGCCTDLYDTGLQICADAVECENPCKKRADTTCDPGSSTMANDCCRGSCVQSTNPDYAGCRPYCNVAEDCDTGCCTLFANSSRGFCVDARYCTCGVTGAACGGERDVACCEGTRCASFGGGAASCRPTCDAANPCTTGSCVAFSDGSGSVCNTESGSAGSGGMGGTGGSGGECAAVLTACGINRDCCAGLLCVGDDPEIGICYQTCADPMSCPTGECLFVDGFPDGFCVQ